MKTALLLIVLLSALNVCAGGVNTHNSSDLRKWSVSISLTKTFKGPADDLANAMRNSGFRKTKSSYSNVSFVMRARYRIASPFSIGLSIGSLNLGTADGGPVSLSVKSSARVIAPVVTGSIEDFLSFGIGPSLCFIEAEDQPIDVDDMVDRYKQTKVGLWLEAELRVPSRSAFFATIDLTAQKLGSAEVGPFNYKFIYTKSTLPATKVNFDNLSVGFGIGFRF
jgi:hypothetical protein